MSLSVHSPSGSCMICSFLLLVSWLVHTMSANKERTFIMIKPDGVQRGLVGEIIRRFETKGFKLVALKMKQVSEMRDPSP